MTGLVLAILLGWAGGYRFYKKQTGLGILYLLTVGLCGIGWIVDIIVAALEYKKQKEYDNRPKCMIFEVAGMNYYTENVMSIAKEKRNYKKTDAELVAAGKLREFRHSFPTTATLLEEPTNQYDKNAIMVMADGVQIGHVPANLCSQVKDIMRTRTINQIGLFISGGEYKSVVNNNVYMEHCELKGEVRLHYQ